MKQLIIAMFCSVFFTTIINGQNNGSLNAEKVENTSVISKGESQPGLFSKIFGYADSLNSIRAKIVGASMSFLGTPYKYASVGPSSFDCSGFISYVYQFYNIFLPHSSALMSRMGEIIDLSSAVKGDLMFFGYKNRDGSVSVSHVGMVFDNTDGIVEMIHASTSDGVRIDKTDSNTWNSYWSRKFLFVKRIID